MTDFLFNAKTLPTPLGKILILADETTLRGVHLETRKTPWPECKEIEEAHPLLDSAISQLQEYFEGSREDFDLPLHAEGSEFQKEVWDALRKIPFGETWSYGDLAKFIDKPKAVRAVGAANGKNPFAIVVPCHRVIGANGKLTGYGGGMQAKQWLLEHEAKLAPDKHPFRQFELF